MNKEGTSSGPTPGEDGSGAGGAGRARLSRPRHGFSHVLHVVRQASPGAGACMFKVLSGLSNHAAVRVTCRSLFILAAVSGEAAGEAGHRGCATAHCQRWIVRSIISPLQSQGSWFCVHRRNQYRGRDGSSFFWRCQASEILEIRHLLHAHHRNTNDYRWRSVSGGGIR